MTTTPVAVRRAVEADAGAIGALHVRAWQWAFRGLMPETYLDDLSGQVGQRAAMWGRLLQSHEHASSSRVWVAEQEGVLIGFCSTSGATGEAGETGEHGKAATAELHTIYLDPAAVGTGVGAALMRRALADLRERGFGAAVLWVQDANHRARRFYERGGWAADGGEKTEDVWGMPVRQLRYCITLAEPTPVA